MNQVSLKTLKGSLSENDFNSYLKIEEEVFGSCLDITSTKERTSRKDFLLIFAELDGKVVGFKSGYKESIHQFYSWTGGVSRENRGVGIASLLMNEQHKQLKDLGYKYVTTKSQNDFKAMMILNLKSGFDIVGTTIGKESELQIQFRKNL